MNYQKLFDLMSEHGLTLLEGEMDEIIDTCLEVRGLNKDLFGEVVIPEPRVLFKAATTKEDDGWMMCDAGRSQDNNKYVITTHHLHADEVPEECMDAKTFCELVAKLLNKHYHKF